jgi:hypothetical protein
MPDESLTQTSRWDFLSLHQDYDLVGIEILDDSFLNDTDVVCVADEKRSEATISGPPSELRETLANGR